MTDDMTDHGNDTAFILGSANLESARAEYELSAKRSAFFLQVQHQAQSWATSTIDMQKLLHSALFRTVSDNALLAAWGWQLEVWVRPDHPSPVSPALFGATLQ